MADRIRLSILESPNPSRHESRWAVGSPVAARWLIDRLPQCRCQMLRPVPIVLCMLLCFSAACSSAEPADLEPIRVNADGSGFETAVTHRPFSPLGFNYDHDRDGRLIEDYWDTEWKSVEQDFAEMHQLGANVVRVHLQFGRFMETETTPNQKALAKLADLIALAEKTELYLDLTGLGCYHKADVPAWYDALGEEQRWAAQSNFWTAIAKTVGESPAVFCYDLMNEPVSPGGKRQDGDWLGPAFGDKHFVQVISLDQANRSRPEIALAWTRHLTSAIRKVDTQHLITIGMVDWSLDRPGLTSGFVPKVIGPELDFIAVHLYPETGKRTENLDTLKGFQIGKPVVIEEIFPLKSSPADLGQFLDEAQPAGVIGFYWGQTIEELTPPKTIGEGVTLEWLRLFEARAQRTGP